MKTTLVLPDELLTDAKLVATRRRTTLKALVESALRRELYSVPPSSKSGSLIELGPNEVPRLKARGTKVTSEMVYQMMESEGC